MQSTSRTTSSSPGAHERDPHARRQPGRPHELLHVFVGTWQVEGRNAPAAPTLSQEPGAGEQVTGEQVYELLPGGFYVMGRWDRRTASGVHVGINVLGHDPDRDTLFAHHYDNLGYAREYLVTVSGRMWTYSGRYERATIELSADGLSYSETWEMSTDGTSWRPLCALSNHRRR
jgi:hypothetical protein